MYSKRVGAIQAAACACSPIRFTPLTSTLLCVSGVIRVIGRTGLELWADTRTNFDYTKLGSAAV